MSRNTANSSFLFLSDQQRSPYSSLSHTPKTDGDCRFLYCQQSIFQRIWPYSDCCWPQKSFSQANLPHDGSDKQQQEQSHFSWWLTASKWSFWFWFWISLVVCSFLHKNLLLFATHSNSLSFYVFQFDYRLDLFWLWLKSIFLAVYGVFLWSGWYPKKIRTNSSKRAPFLSITNNDDFPVNIVRRISNWGSNSSSHSQRDGREMRDENRGLWLESIWKVKVLTELCFTIERLKSFPTFQSQRDEIDTQSK